MPDIDTLDKRFRKLFQDGKLVHIHVSKWGMSHQLSKTDLGLDKETEDKTKLPDFITLGKKYLFDDDVRLKFTRIESAARNFLRDNSHKFPIADAHFVPQKNLIKVINTLNTYKVEYDEVTVTFLENYEKHKQEMFLKYPDHKALLEPFYPIIADIRCKFGFSVNIFEVAIPKNLKTLNLEDVVAQNLAVEEAKKKYEVQMAKQYEEAKGQMTDFFKEVAIASRNEVAATFEKIAKKIQDREIITGTNLNTIKVLVESFDAMDFLNDSKIKENLAAVKKLVVSGADFKDDEEALGRLNTAITTTLESARNITDIDQITGGYIRRLDLD